jgi:cell wall-associated NlpC family hydrolase
VTGPTRTPKPVLDPRRNAVRSDLAAEHLAREVDSPRYARGTPRRVMRPAAPVRRSPSHGAGLDTEALFGEEVMVYDEAGGWAWVQLIGDGYVGYVPSDTLSTALPEPTHRVRAAGTFVYPAPDIKAPPLMHLSLNSEIAIVEMGERISRLLSGGYVVSRHITVLGQPARDFVAVAERLIGTPYLWGGKTRIGLDCSGLVQVALQAAGFRAPRDSDMQEAELGRAIPVPETLEGLVRGDLLFWPGHVGIMTDGIMLLHANAHHMAVAVETLPEAADRIAKAGSPIRTIRRLPGLTA